MISFKVSVLSTSTLPVFCKSPIMARSFLRIRCISFAMVPVSSFNLRSPAPSLVGRKSNCAVCLITAVNWRIGRVILVPNRIPITADIKNATNTAATIIFARLYASAYTSDVGAVSTSFMPLSRSKYISFLATP